MLFVLFCCAFLELFSLDPTAAEANFRIVNGTNALQNEFPFMVSIQNNSQHICGGTIVNSKFVLTAAHCVCEVRLDNLEVCITHSLGSQNRTSIPAKNVTCGPYSPLEKRHDIAVIELNATIPTRFFQPVRLVEETFSTRENSEGILLGWGQNGTGTQPMDILQKVDVVVYNDSICWESYFGMYDMEYNMCAGWPENGRGSCQGDSGGPLLINGRQAGIISFGASGNCGISDPDRPKILTRLSKYLDWITNNTRITNGNKSLSQSNVGLLYFALLLLFYTHVATNQ